MMYPMKKSKTRLEGEVMREVGDYLKDNGYFFWRSNNGAVYDTRKGSYRHLPRFSRRGLPDYSIVFNGTYIGIEIKREGGKLRPEQIQFRDEVHAHGGCYFVIHSGKEMELCLKARGFYPRQ